MREECLGELREEMDLRQGKLERRLREVDENLAEAAVDQHEKASLRLEAAVLTARIARQRRRGEDAEVAARVRWAKADHVAAAASNIEVSV